MRSYHQHQHAASYLIQPMDCLHIWTPLFSQCPHSLWEEALKALLEFSLSPIKAPGSHPNAPFMFYENRSKAGEVQRVRDTLAVAQCRCWGSHVGSQVSTATLLSVSWLFTCEWLECLDLMFLIHSAHILEIACLPISCWLVVWTWRYL